jgi:hypothetical protein
MQTQTQKKVARAYRIDRSIVLDRSATRTLFKADRSMTANIYRHTSAEAERDAAIALERAIYCDLFPVVPNSRTGTTLRR